MYLYLPQDLLAFISQPFVQQSAPLVVLFLIPFLVLVISTNHQSEIYWSVAMVLENLGLGFRWWNGEHVQGDGHDGGERKKGRKKHGHHHRHHSKSRSEHTTGNGNAMHEKVDDNGGYYPGLVNIAGNYCFLNSTLQAMASLSYLQPHIDAVHAKAEALDVPTPVIDALQELFHTLNTPNSTPSSLRPLAIISALTTSSQSKHLTLFSSRSHQDAQELFQLLSESLKAEIAAVDMESLRDRGFGGLVVREVEDAERRGEIGKSVFDGLTANRRSCVECGYTEAVMHFAFDNWQLAVPMLKASCQLEDCLDDYTRLELLTDCICRKCSLLATHRRLVAEAEKLFEAIKSDPNASVSKKKRARDARKLEGRVKAALEEGRIEDDIKGVKMEKVFSKASTKQAMVARPPPVLALHINRSVHYGTYASKNMIRLIFPETLDLTPYTTSGQLSLVPSIPISSPVPRSATPTPATYAVTRTIYRLSAVVCHYGQHSFGHYVCFRRKPPGIGKRWSPPRIRQSDEAGGWLRISDDSVRECEIESVLAEGSGAFMLYYERIALERSGVYPYERGSPRSSEETLKPEMVGSGSGAGSYPNGNASTSTLSLGVVGGVEAGLAAGLKEEKMGPGRLMGPRVVRSVAAGRGRSSSAGPAMERKQNSQPEILMNGNAVNGDAKGKGKVVERDTSSDAGAERLLAKSTPNLGVSPERPPEHLHHQAESSLPPVALHRPVSPPPSPSHQQPPPPERIQSPQPIHPTATHMIGLSLEGTTTI